MKRPAICQIKTGLYLKIYLFGLLHVCIKSDHFVGFQSWVMGTDVWGIEYYTTTGMVYCEYDSAEKWQAILNALNEKL